MDGTPTDCMLRGIEFQFLCGSGENGSRTWNLRPCPRINLTYNITPEILAKLRTAKNIGYHLQHFPDSAMFVGYDSLPFEEGAAKLPGLLDVYFREPDLNERPLQPTPTR